MRGGGSWRDFFLSSSGSRYYSRRGSRDPVTYILNPPLDCSVHLLGSLCGSKALALTYASIHTHAQKEINSQLESVFNKHNHKWILIDLYLISESSHARIPFYTRLIV